MSREMGKIRPSQLVYHYGPGAIIDLVDESVMMMAADLWNTFNAPKETDIRIRQALEIDHVRLLNENPDSVKVRAIPFPKWKICPKCEMMTNFSTKHCYHCNKKGEEVELYPSRFIVACEKGHIQDFPYLEWVHQKNECTSSKPQLKFIRDGQSGSLSDLSVQCVKCKEKQSLGTIMKKGVLKSVLPACSGERPWIGDREDCIETMDTYLRGASNIYSPSVTSFLQIPLSEENRDPLVEKILNRKEDIESAKEDGEEGLHYYYKRILKLNPSDFEKVERILNGEFTAEVTYESLRKQEWNTLVQKDVDDTYNTGYKSSSVEINPQMQQYFSAIHRVDSLPEIQVLQGFSRIEYLDRFELNQRKHLIPIMKDSKTNWLPGVRNNGEGIFFQFNESSLSKWESNTLVEEITSEIITRYNKQRDRLGYKALSIKSRHLLLHTFGHALIKELAAHSGYSTTALQERIYCSDVMHGVLIYTASGDSEGSLGGLIEQAHPDKLYPIFLRAVERMMYCSSDPHCSEGTFKLHSTANGAACHTCAFVSETSCEWGNQLLDRRLLLNINPGETTGFFSLG